jgi:putative ABC transport system permease protein
VKFFPLVWSSLLRRKLRTVFTLLSVVAAFTLFGVLMAIRAGFTAGITVTGAERLVMLD